MEGDRLLGAPDVGSERIVGAEAVQRPQMEDDDKGEQIVQRVEADEGRVAELAIRARTRGVRALPARDGIVDFDFDVRLELPAALVVPPCAPEEASPAHERTGRRMRLMAVTTASHRRVCAVSLRRPAGVSL